MAVYDYMRSVVVEMTERSLWIVAVEEKMWYVAMNVELSNVIA